MASGGPEPEGAGLSPLNSVSDSNMCPTENGHFFTKEVNISVSVREYFFISYCLFLSIFPSLFLPFFFLNTFFPFPTHFFSFFCYLFSVRQYPVSDARAFPGRPGRPARYALVNGYYHLFYLPTNSDIFNPSGDVHHILPRTIILFRFFLGGYKGEGKRNKDTENEKKKNGTSARRLGISSHGRLDIASRLLE